MPKNSISGDRILFKLHHIGRDITQRLEEICISLGDEEVVFSVSESNHGFVGSVLKNNTLLTVLVEGFLVILPLPLEVRYTVCIHI